MTPPARRASVASPTSPAAAGSLPALASLTVPTPVGDALLIASPEGLLALELVAGGQRASERGRTRDGGDGHGGDDRGGGAGEKVGADAPNDRTLRRGVFGPGGEPVFAIDAHIGDGGRARAHAGDHGAEGDSANDPGAASGLDASPQLVAAGAILRDAAAQLLQESASRTDAADALCADLAQRLPKAVQVRLPHLEAPTPDAIVRGLCDALAPHLDALLP
ncbi:MAG TPA: hypothetical protein PKH61_08165, partial [Microbacteriaceae bacterium]|nr:hypothetical protein [Microbacteriaceae bacterium]